MKHKRFAKNIIALIILILAGCVAPATPTHNGQSQAITGGQTQDTTGGQTQGVTSDPQVYLPLVTVTYTATPSACPATSSVAANTPTADQSTDTASPQDAAVTGNYYYVTTSGKSSGDGSISHPWDLDSALLNSKNKVAPGDTIWVCGGTYHPTIEPAKFNIKLKGTSGHPIYVRAYPGDRVTIDARIEIYQPYVVFWGFEVMSSSLDRTSSQTGSHPSDMNRSGGIGVYAGNATLINNVVHDGRDGITADADAPNTVLYGNISYNNGWDAPDRGHGHGVYTQNETGTKDIEENIVFNNFGRYSFHTYTEGSYLYNYTFVGNVVLNDEFLVGGLTAANNISLTNNYVYNAILKLGYDSQGNTGLTLDNNWLWNLGDDSLEVYWWNGVKVANNHIFNSSGKVVSLRYPSSKGSYSWNNNQYASSASSPFSLNDSSKSWSQWLSNTGYDGSSQFTSSYPSGTQVFVRPNAYDAKRGNIIVFNWNHSNNVSVNISSLGLRNGDKYTLHNVQNYYAETISGTYNGNPISIPMTGWSVAVPIGWNQPLRDSTFPNFGVFVLTSP